MKAIILIGGQCAGKSRWAKEHVSRELNIDVDDFKAQLPGYEPQRAYMFHAESSMCAKEALQNALLEKKDVIYHHHGRSGIYPDDIDELVNLFLQYGYDIRAVYVSVPIEVARERYQARERITSVGSFEESYKRALREVERLKQRGIEVGEAAREVNGWAGRSTPLTPEERSSINAFYLTQGRERAK